MQRKVCLEYFKKFVFLICCFSGFCLKSFPEASISMGFKYEGPLCDHWNFWYFYTRTRWNILFGRLFLVRARKKGPLWQVFQRKKRRINNSKNRLYVQFQKQKNECLKSKHTLSASKKFCHCGLPVKVIYIITTHKKNKKHRAHLLFPMPVQLKIPVSIGGSMNYISCISQSIRLYCQSGSLESEASIS